jgi:hypothetical protein
MRTPTLIRDEDYLPMIVADPKVRVLLICPVCGAAISRASRRTHTAWHGHVDVPAAPATP